MAGQSSAMFGWSWSEVSVLGSQVFGQALLESCALACHNDTRLMSLIVVIVFFSGFKGRLQLLTTCLGYFLIESY